MPFRIVIVVADKQDAEDFVKDVLKTQSFCYIDADGDENEQGVQNIYIEE